MATRVVLATRNAGKVHELRQILAEHAADLDLEIVSVADLDGVPVVEDARLVDLVATLDFRHRRDVGDGFGVLPLRQGHAVSEARNRS